MSDQYSCSFAPNIAHNLHSVTSVAIDSTLGIVVVGASGGVYATALQSLHSNSGGGGGIVWDHVVRVPHTALVHGVPSTSDPHSFSRILVACKDGNAVHVLQWPDLTSVEILSVPIRMGSNAQIEDMTVSHTGSMFGLIMRDGAFWVGRTDITYPSVTGAAVGDSQVWVARGKKMSVLDMCSNHRTAVPMPDTVSHQNIVGVKLCENVFLVIALMEDLSLVLVHATTKVILNTIENLFIPAGAPPAAPSSAHVQRSRVWAIVDDVWRIAVVGTSAAGEVALLQEDASESWCSIPMTDTGSNHSLLIPHVATAAQQQSDLTSVHAAWDVACQVGLTPGQEWVPIAICVSESVPIIARLSVVNVSRVHQQRFVKNADGVIVRRRVSRVPGYRRGSTSSTSHFEVEDEPYVGGLSRRRSSLHKALHQHTAETKVTSIADVVTKCSWLRKVLLHKEQQQQPQLETLFQAFTTAEQPSSTPVATPTPTDVAPPVVPTPSAMNDSGKGKNVSFTVQELNPVAIGTVPVPGVASSPKSTQKVTSPKQSSNTVSKTTPTTNAPTTPGTNTPTTKINPTTPITPTPSFETTAATTNTKTVASTQSSSTQEGPAKATGKGTPNVATPKMENVKPSSGGQQQPTPEKVNKSNASNVPRVKDTPAGASDTTTRSNVPPIVSQLPLGRVLEAKKGGNTASSVETPGSAGGGAASPRKKANTSVDNTASPRNRGLSAKAKTEQASKTHEKDTEESKTSGDKLPRSRGNTSILNATAVALTRGTLIAKQTEAPRPGVFAQKINKEKQQQQVSASVVQPPPPPPPPSKIMSGSSNTPSSQLSNAIPNTTNKPTPTSTLPQSQTQPTPQQPLQAKDKPSQETTAASASLVPPPPNATPTSTNHFAQNIVHFDDIIQHRRQSHANNNSPPSSPFSGVGEGRSWGNMSTRDWLVTTAPRARTPSMFPLAEASTSTRRPSEFGAQDYGSIMFIRPDDEGEVRKDLSDISVLLNEDGNEGMGISSVFKQSIPEANHSNIEINFDDDVSPRSSEKRPKPLSMTPQMSPRQSPQHSPRSAFIHSKIRIPRHKEVATSPEATRCFPHSTVARWTPFHYVVKPISPRLKDKLQHPVPTPRTFENTIGHDSPSRRMHERNQRILQQRPQSAPLHRTVPLKVHLLQRNITQKSSPVPRLHLLHFTDTLLHTILEYVAATVQDLIQTAMASKRLRLLSFNIFDTLVLSPEVCETSSRAVDLRQKKWSTFLQFIALRTRGQHIRKLGLFNITSSLSILYQFPLHVPLLTYLDVRGVNVPDYSPPRDNWLVDVCSHCPKLTSLCVGSMWMYGWVIGYRSTAPSWWSHVPHLHYFEVGSRESPVDDLVIPSSYVFSFPDAFFCEFMCSPVLKQVHLWVPLARKDYVRIASGVHPNCNIESLTLNCIGHKVPTPLCEFVGNTIVPPTLPTSAAVGLDTATKHHHHGANSPARSHPPPTTPHSLRLPHLRWLRLFVEGVGQKDVIVLLHTVLGGGCSGKLHVFSIVNRPLALVDKKRSKSKSKSVPLIIEGGLLTRSGIK